MQDVTVISCLYGEGFGQFEERWREAVLALRPSPREYVVATDCVMDGWTHPQARHLQAALDQVETEWVWIHDIDDIAFPDALEGLDKVAADVWQLGYLRSDGETYIPPQLSADEVLATARIPFVGTSCVRTEALRDVGGFPDVALQDWALWRALARNGATFQSSGRPHFHYMRHDATRGIVELTVDERPAHLREMQLFEERHALTI